MNFLFGFFSEMWRQQLEFEVRRQSVRGSLLALRAVIGSTRRVVLFAVYVLVFLYALFGLLTVAITSSDLSQEVKPLVIYGLLAALFGGLLIYNLREETWIKRWGIRERIAALESERALPRETSAVEPPPEYLMAERMQKMLERFEERMESRLEAFEKRQERLERKLREPILTSRGGNSTTQDLALY
jgi:hypothetical protein